MERAIHFSHYFAFSPPPAAPTDNVSTMGADIFVCLSLMNIQGSHWIMNEKMRQEGNE